MKNLFSFLLVFGLIFSLFGDEIRIASLSPALTEIIFTLNKGNHLVGRSSACDYPKEVENIPVVGNFANPELEKLAKAKPTLVISDVFQDPIVIKTIESMGIETIIYPLQNLADYRHVVLELGKKLKAEQAAQKEIERFDSFIMSCRKQNKEKSEIPSVLFLVWHSPLMAPGKKSFITEYIELAGGQSITALENRNYFQLSPEWVIKENPQVIITSSGAKEKDLPKAWRNLLALKNNKVISLDVNSVVSRLSPRFNLAIEELRSSIYGL